MKTRLPTKREALLVIEGLALHAEDCASDTKKAEYYKNLLDQIYTYAHITQASCCKNDKQSIERFWQSEAALKKMGII